MKRRALLLLALLLTATAAGAAPPDDAAVDLRDLDGTLEASAKDGPSPLVSEEGMELRAWWEDGMLRVAVRSEPLFVASLCLGTDDRVRVLHASAALGSVTYTRGKDGWTTGDAFDWQVRDKTMSDAAVAARRDYLATQGWVGTTVPMGTKGHTEFVVDPRLLPAGTRIAIGLMRESDPENVTGHPAVAKGCGDRSLVGGPAPERLEFSPAAWPALPPAPPSP